jgi:GNAT superfamily N-acetyltransferase
VTVTTRLAGRDDIDILLADVQAGFDSYVEFNPPGWEPPDAFADRDANADLLGDAATWAMIASSGDQPIGHIAFFPAKDRVLRVPIPGMAHLWQLFVLPDWWGRGIAALLHESALEEWRARGFAVARLYTPSLHTRARRFYERRGWCLEGEQWSENLDLMLVEYRLPLQ